jgi:hypothetical protein
LNVLAIRLLHAHTPTNCATESMIVLLAHILTLSPFVNGAVTRMQSARPRDTSRDEFPLQSYSCFSNNNGSCIFGFCLRSFSLLLNACWCFFSLLVNRSTRPCRVFALYLSFLIIVHEM